MAFEKAASDVWEVTPAEIGLLADDGENPVSLGIVPRNAAAASVSIVDYLTGETVETLEISLGETVAFQPLPAGYYYIQAACQDYTDYKGGVWLVSGAQEGSAAFPVNLENPEAVFEEPVKVRVLNEDGKAESRCAIAIAVTRNNTRHISSMELETDRAGYVCFISTSEAEDSTSDIYRVAQFSLREGCILGYYNEEAEFVPVVMDGSSECVIRLG